MLLLLWHAMECCAGLEAESTRFAAEDLKVETASRRHQGAYQYQATADHNSTVLAWIAVPCRSRCRMCWARVPLVPPSVRTGGVQR